MDKEKLIRELNNCAMACNSCFRACLGEEHVLHLTRCIELDRECADICQQAATMLATDSENIDHILSVCADICKQCAAECSNHGHQHCQDCAKACSSCHDMCLEYRQVLNGINS